jgi:hypothetical protein
MNPIPYVEHDGGRASAGFVGTTGDCVVRAIAIASGCSYLYIYEKVNMLSRSREKRVKGWKSGARIGIYTFRPWFKEFMQTLGFVWTPTMGIGTGCKVHLRAGELPMGRLVVSLSKHMAAVIDGVLYDNHNCSREGTRCVYGYWKMKEAQ